MKYPRWQWLLPGLALSVLVLVSALLPWWLCQIHIPDMETGAASVLNVRIYEYGLRHDLVQLRPYIAADETPVYQTYLALGFAALSAGAMAISGLLRGRKGALLLGGAGLAYLAYAAAAIFLVVQDRTADLGVKLTGWRSVTYTEAVDIVVSAHSRLQPGYYLALAAGLACVLLAVARLVIERRREPRSTPARAKG